jgi:hypothetical protein
MQPSDEYPQGNVLTEEEQAIIKMNDSHRTPRKEDTQPAAQLENEDSSPSPEPYLRRLSKQEHEADNMKKIFATLAENTQKQLREQGEKHAMEIAATKRANLDTQHLLTTKTTPYNRSFQCDDQTFRNTLQRNTGELTGIPTPPPKRIPKPNHRLESRYHKLPTHVWHL